MDIDIKDVDPPLFAAAIEHISQFNPSRFCVFKDRRQNEGPWLTAFIVVGGRRHVVSTVDVCTGRSLQEQAERLALLLEHFEPAPRFDHGV